MDHVHALSDAATSLRIPEASVPLALLDSGLGVEAIRLWLLVRATAGGDYLPTTSLTRTGMAGAVGVSPATVKRYMRQLIATGWLARETRQNRSSALMATYAEQDVAW